MQSSFLSTMSKESHQTTFATLQNGRHSGEVNVRVTRLWKKFFKDSPDVPYSAELVFIDVEGKAIQATIRRPVLNRYLPQVIEGRTYKLSRFMVEDNIGTHRATSHPNRIMFEYSTKVVETHNLSIPLYGFQLKSFEDIVHQNGVDESHYIDVVGELIQCHDIQLLNGGNKRTIIDLQDECGDNISCIVWGNYCDEIITIVNQFINLPKPVIVLQCVRRDSFRDEVRITTTWGATKIYVNLECSQVSEFKSRRLSLGPSANSSMTISATEPRNILHRAKLKSVADLKKTDKAGYYVTFAKIYELDIRCKWYYESCKLCKSKANLADDGLWYCTKVSSTKDCPGKVKGSTSTIPRFGPKFFASDRGDILELKIFDDPTARYVDKTCSDVLSEQKKAGDMDGTPCLFDAFIDRQFVFKVLVTHEFNVAGNSKSYGVVAICQDQDVIDQWKKECYSLKGKCDVDSPSVDDGSTVSSVKVNNRINIPGDDEFVTPCSSKIAKKLFTDDKGSSSKTLPTEVDLLVGVSDDPPDGLDNDNLTMMSILKQIKKEKK